MLHLNPNLLWMIAGTFGALSIGTTLRLIALRNASPDVARKRIGSLKVWWLLALLWSTAALFGQIGVGVLVALASVLSLREYLRLIGTTEQIGRFAIGCLFVVGAIHYLLIVCGSAVAARLFFPITALLLFGAVRSTTCDMQHYTRITAGLYWGSMLMIYGLSHALFLFDVGSDVDPSVGRVGWFLFLVLLTETNDIMQALVGRKFGQRKITPGVSPNKSLEGLVGGLASTVLLSVLLAPLLTTLTLGRSPISGIGLSIIAGIFISLVGFLGDINMSAIKRDAGIKDGSSLLPGMGGVIDRIDSLIFTGPVFYYFVVLLDQLSVNPVGK